MKVEKKTNIFNFVIILLFTTILLSLLLMNTSYAKNVDAQSDEWELNAQSFYFGGDNVEEIPNDFYYIDDIEIEIHNYLDALITDYDIEYEIIISDIVSIGETSVDITDSANGILLGGEESLSLITLTPHNDISEFEVSIRTTNGYLMTLMANCIKT